MDRVTAQAQARFVIDDLLVSYGRCIDRGDMEALGALFGQGRLLLTDGREFSGPQDVGGFFRDLIQFYDADGAPAPYERSVTTPMTQHLVLNSRYRFDNAVSHADVESAFLVSQLCDGELKQIAAGRYEDVFDRDLAGWHFTTRRIHIDLPGDLSRHLRA